MHRIYQKNEGERCSEKSVHFFCNTEIKSISTEVLDNLYEVYCNKEQRQVEGFIILDKSSNTIRKYVRYNREGKLVPHKETGGK